MLGRLRAGAATEVRPRGETAVLANPANRLRIAANVEGKRRFIADTAGTHLREPRMPACWIADVQGP